jgi:hypothetical protein
MNPFECHSIGHLSASSLNLARNNLPLWVVQYLFGEKGQPSLAMIAGNAAEDGVAHGLFNPDANLEDCQTIARDSFMRRTALGGFDTEARKSKLSEIVGYPGAGRKKAAPGMVAGALESLRPYGTPTRPQGHHQNRIEITLDGIPVPVIGYKDFAFDDHGLDVDLKTTTRMPSDMSADHQLQGAIYWKASGNRAQRFCYATKADAVVLELSADAAHEAIKAATGIAHCLARFLALSGDRNELARLIIPDYGNFRWDAGTGARAREIWGF